MKLPNLAISTLFLIVTLANSLKFAGTMGYYALFTEDFIERFCENKARPELQCNGTCELSKMLSEGSDKQQAPINLDFIKIETVLFLDTIFKVDFYKMADKKFNPPLYSNLYHFTFVDRVIHPPKT